jgi:general secretion pathway protein M
MKERLQVLWRLRTLREQRLLLVGGALAAAMILWFAVLAPLDSALSDARKRHERAALALADARSQAAAVRRLQRTAPPSLPAPLQVLVGELASEAGFAVARVEPQSARQVNLVITAARAPALFVWASDLEKRHGLVIEQLSARANNDATLAAEISIRARSR